MRRKKKILRSGMVTCPECGESMTIFDEFSLGLLCHEFMEPKEIKGELIIEVPKKISFFCSCEHEYVFRVVLKEERKKR